LGARYTVQPGEDIDQRVSATLHDRHGLLSLKSVSKMAKDGKLSYIFKYEGKDVSNYVLDINSYLLNNTNKIIIISEGNGVDITPEQLEENGLTGN
jgi:hypothetical protein